MKKFMISLAAMTLLATSAFAGGSKQAVNAVAERHQMGSRQAVNAVAERHQLGPKQSVNAVAERHSVATVTRKMATSLLNLNRK